MIAAVGLSVVGTLLAGVCLWLIEPLAFGVALGGLLVGIGVTAVDTGRS